MIFIQIVSIILSFLFLYYFYVFIRLGMGEYYEKRDFLLALIPFCDTFRGLYTQWKKLD